MMGLRIVPKTWAQLRAMLTPERADQPESLPYSLYDTQTYVSGTTTRLTFFQSVQTDRTLSNMETSGTLPQPQFFEVHKLFIDVLSRPSTNAAAAPLGQADDLSLLFHAARATITYTGSGKRWGPIPARATSPLSAINANIAATLTAPANVSAGWRDFTGGFPVNGALLMLRAKEAARCGSRSMANTSPPKPTSATMHAT